MPPAAAPPGGAVLSCAQIALPGAGLLGPPAGCSGPAGARHKSVLGWPVAQVSCVLVLDCTTQWLWLTQRMFHQLQHAGSPVNLVYCQDYCLIVADGTVNSCMQAAQRLAAQCMGVTRMPEWLQGAAAVSYQHASLPAWSYQPCLLQLEQLGHPQQTLAEPQDL